MCRKKFSINHTDTTTTRLCCFNVAISLFLSFVFLHELFHEAIV